MTMCKHSHEEHDTDHFNWADANASHSSPTSSALSVTDTVKNTKNARSLRMHGREKARSRPGRVRVVTKGSLEGSRRASLAIEAESVEPRAGARRGNPVVSRGGPAVPRGRKK
jgi:hypothetical protein